MKNKFGNYFDKTDGSKDLQFLRAQMKSYLETFCIGDSPEIALIKKFSLLLKDSLTFRINSLRSHHKEFGPILTDLMSFSQAMPAATITHLIASPKLTQAQRQAVIDADILCQNIHRPTQENASLLVYGPMANLIKKFALKEEAEFGSNSLTRALFYSSVLDVLQAIERCKPNDHKKLKTLATTTALRHLSSLIGRINIPVAERHEFLRFLFWHCVIFNLNDYFSAQKDPFLAAFGAFMARTHDYLHRGQRWAFVDCDTLGLKTYDEADKAPLDALAVRFWDSDIIGMICAQEELLSSDRSDIAGR